MLGRFSQLASSLRQLSTTIEAVTSNALQSYLPSLANLHTPQALTSSLLWRQARMHSILDRSFGTTTSSWVQATSGEVESLEQVRSRIFGMHIGNGLRSGRKVLARKLKGHKIASYYPTMPDKLDPFMVDLKAEAARIKLDKLRRRGKAPPKKGAGKRASKKK